MADELTEKILWRRKCIKGGVLFLLGFLVGGVLPYLGIRFFDNLFGAKYPVLGPIAEFFELPAMLTTGALFGSTLVGCLKFAWFQYCLNRICPDPPSFVASDLARARQNTMILLKKVQAPFVGPYTNPQNLDDLVAGDPGPFSWRSLIGPSGIGKTRLALEWLQHWKDTGKWDVGLVDNRDKEKITGWRPRRPTALVIDNVDEHWQDSLGLTLFRLGENARSQKEVRVLMVGQIEPFISHKDFETTNSKSYEVVKTAKIKDNNPLRLSGLAMPELASLKDLANYDKSSPEELLQETKGRPLAALIMFEHDVPTYTEALQQWTDFVCAEMDKEVAQAIVLTALVGSFSSGQAASLVKLDPDKLARYFDAINMENTEVILPEMPKILAQEILLRAFRRLNTDFEPLLEKALAINPDVVQARIAGICRARPELFKAREKGNISVAWLQKIQDRLDALAPGRIQALREEINALVDETAAAELELSRLTQIMARLADLADSRPWDTDIRLQEAKAACNAMFEYGQWQQWLQLEEWGKRLINLAENERFSDDPNMRLLEAKAAYTAMANYGKAQDWDALEKWGDRLVSLAENPRWADDGGIRYCEASGTYNAMLNYGQWQQLPQLEEWGKRLINLVEDKRFAGDPDMRLLEAQAATNAILAYGSSQKWEQLEEWGKRLIDLANDSRWTDNVNIRYWRAVGTNNAVAAYGRAEKFDQMERWGERLIDLANEPHWAEDVVIRFWESVGVGNALTSYADCFIEKSSNSIDFGIKLNDKISYGGFFNSDLSHDDALWRSQALPYRPRVEQWLQRLEALAKNDRLANELNIRVNVATGLLYAVKYYARVQLCDEIAHWQQRLETVIADARFKNNAVIRLVELHNLWNIITFFYGPQENRKVLEELGERLVRLAEEAPFTDDPNIRFVEAIGLLNLMIFNGNMSLFPDMERWGAHLVALAAAPQFFNNPKIRSVEAYGASQALLLYPAESSRREYWLKRLAACAREFLRDKKIQELAQRHGVSFSQQIENKGNLPGI